MPTAILNVVSVLLGYAATPISSYRLIGEILWCAYGFAIPSKLFVRCVSDMHKANRRLPLLSKMHTAI